MPSAVIVEHQKRKDLRLEKVLLQAKPSDNEVMGRVEISPRRKCAIPRAQGTPTDGGGGGMGEGGVSRPGF